MLTTYRLQIRKPIHAPGEQSADVYVFRDVELPFLPLPGLRVQDFDGQEYRITDDLVWREGQHRFICYDLPHREDEVAPERGLHPRPVDEIVADYEARGWKRNQRGVERMRA